MQRCSAPQQQQQQTRFSSRAAIPQRKNALWVRRWRGQTTSAPIFAGRASSADRADAFTGRQNSQSRRPDATQRSIDVWPSPSRQNGPPQTHNRPQQRFRNSSTCCPVPWPLPVAFATGVATGGAAKVCCSVSPRPPVPLAPTALSVSDSARAAAAALTAGRRGQQQQQQQQRGG